MSSRILRRLRRIGRYLSGKRTHSKRHPCSRVLADSGAVGIKEFTLNEGLADLDYGEDVREHLNKLATEEEREAAA